MEITIEDIQKRADATVDLHRIYADVVSKIGVPASTRLSIAHDCLLLAIELQGAIGTLIRFHHFAGAFALLRPLMETTLRSAWLLYVADYQSIAKFLENKNTMDLDRFANALLKKSGHSELQSISRKVIDNKHIYHSFAHCGIEQLARRRNGFKPDELMTGLMTADFFAVISGEIGGLAHRNDELRRLTSTHAGRLAKESRVQTGHGDEPPASWTGALPPLPCWNDPEP